MRVLHYLELAGALERSGIGTSVSHQRTALTDTAATVYTSPWAESRPARSITRRLGGGRHLVDVDLVHCNMIGPGSVAVAQYARRTDTPLVLHAHVTREDFRGSFRGSDLVAPVLGRYLRWFYSQADLVLCPSEYTRAILEDYPVDASVRPITNGVDLDRLAGFESLREEYRSRYDLSGLSVFAVGNVFERKGLSTFCRVAERTDHAFTWFGPYDTGLRASKPVRRWVSDPPENVTFTGWVEDIRGAYAAGDVFLFPAAVENQGIAVLEAMACGKAVVLSDIPVFREYYEDGHDCLVCADEDEFVAALERLADDPDLRDRLGRNARETAADHGLDRVGDRLVSAYETVL